VRQELVRRVQRVRRALPKNNQHGFTLIELLVVVAILGILAAVVTMSMVGVTQIAQQRAAQSELATVQTAYDTMLADQGVPAGSECQGASGSTNNMNSFPTTTLWTSTPSHALVALAPHYLRGNAGDPNNPQGGFTHGSYHCTTNGRIVQDSYTP
jgi:prepilin-type N-terminal cleavage/methylation domain-containing protein